MVAVSCNLVPNSNELTVGSSVMDLKKVHDWNVGSLPVLVRTSSHFIRIWHNITAYGHHLPSALNALNLTAFPNPRKHNEKDLLRKILFIEFNLLWLWRGCILLYHLKSNQCPIALLTWFYFQYSSVTKHVMPTKHLLHAISNFKRTYEEALVPGLWSQSRDRSWSQLELTVLAGVRVGAGVSKILPTSTPPRSCWMPPVRYQTIILAERVCIVSKILKDV